MDLPAGIDADILSRIPIKTLVRCRCVCKRWRSILSEPYFVNLHLSRSPAVLVIHQQRYMREADILKLGQLDDKSDHHDIHRDPLMIFDIQFGCMDHEPVLSLCGSVNGLICIWYHSHAGATYICNPITREYILLPDHKYIRQSNDGLTCGFGFVETSNQYKVVSVYRSSFSLNQGSYKSECEVYTLGTGIWRSLGQIPFLLSDCQNGIFLSGNLHWLAYYHKDTATIEMVCTFNLEKELFQLTASVPQVGGVNTFRSLGMLGGCLCICDNTLNSELAIWVMKDYGMKESWSKEIIINSNDMRCQMVHPLKVLKDGTILMLCYDNFFFTYHPRTKTVQIFDIFGSSVCDAFDAMVHVPSLIRLKSFMLEKVSVF